MTWGTALRMVNILRADPSSMLASALEGWDHPVSRLEAIVMDLWDLTAAAAAGGKKAPKYPREWAKGADKVRRGDAAGRTAEQVLSALRPVAPI